MFASFNDVFKGKSLREKKVPDVTLKYLSNNLPKISNPFGINIFCFKLMTLSKIKGSERLP